MVKIIKNGVIPKKKKIIYMITNGSKCATCGCEFEFEIEDCESVERSLDGRLSIKCPFCNTLITIPRNFLKYREEEIESSNVLNEK